MSKLFNAEFHRLIKNIPFWAGTVFSVLWAVYNVMGVNFGYSPGIESFMFGNYFSVLILTGLTSALFIGEEYACGAIRNKLSTGHTRRDIYLTELAMCSGMMIWGVCIYMLTALVCGIIRGYGFDTEMGTLLKVLVCCLFTALAAAAVIVPFSLDLHTKVSGLIAAALVMLALTLAGNHLYQSLKQPEYRINYLFDENGQPAGEDGVYKNKYYIGDKKRIATEMIYILDPIAAAYYEGEIQYDEEIYCERSKIVDKPFAKIPICSLAECVVLTGVGLFIFKRKDLK
ncbi:MAG: ABC transporter permease subunit [Ruminococcus sp.]|nr:ABC transporter permease subunit [Ruminococcus sp.]